MIDYFGPFVIMKSLKHNDEVTEMKQQITVVKQVGTGGGLFRRSELNAHWDMWECNDWGVGPLDAPETMPAGSSERDVNRYIGLCNMPSLVCRGGW